MSFFITAGSCIGMVKCTVRELPLHGSTLNRQRKACCLRLGYIEVRLCKATPNSRAFEFYIIYQNVTERSFDNKERPHLCVLIFVDFLVEGFGC